VNLRKRDRHNDTELFIRLYPGKAARQNSDREGEHTLSGRVPPMKKAAGSITGR
jgi:hypothetical protein